MSDRSSTDLDEERAAGEEVDAEALILQQPLDLVPTAKSMPLSSSVLVVARGAGRAAAGRARAPARRAAPGPVAAARSARSSWPSAAARPTRSWTRSGPRPSTWCSAPRSCARPTRWPSASSTTPTRRPAALRHEAEDFADQQAGQLRDRARPDHEDGAGRAREAPGHARPQRRDRRRRRPRCASAGRGPPDATSRTASSTRTSPEPTEPMAADPFVVHVARLRRSPGAAGARGRAAARSRQAGPIDGGRHRPPGRSVVPAGADGRVPT